jgi:hypothetical protein
MKFFENNSQNFLSKPQKEDGSKALIKTVNKKGEYDA